MILYYYACTIFFTVTCESFPFEKEYAPNVGTVLFSASDIEKKHWGKNEVGLLQARKYFQNLLPPPIFINTFNEDHVNRLLVYFKDAYAAIKKEAKDPESDTIMTTALSDAIGGYLKVWVLPVAKLDYYGGTISQGNVVKLFQFYNEIKRYLDTNGDGWHKPDEKILNSMTINVAPLQLFSNTRSIKDPCDNLAYFEKTPTGLTIPTPNVNWKDKSSTMFVPLKNASLILMNTPDTSQNLIKYYIAARSCIQSSHPKQQEHFDQKFQRWLMDEVVPHLKDDNLYLALGSVLTLVNKTQTLCNSVLDYHKVKPKPNTKIPCDTSSKKMWIITIILLIEIAWCVPALIFVLCYKKLQKKDCSSNVYLFIDNDKKDKDKKESKTSCCEDTCLACLENIPGGTQILRKTVYSNVECIAPPPSSQKRNTVVPGTVPCRKFSPKTCLDRVGAPIETKTSETCDDSRKFSLHKLSSTQYRNSTQMLALMNHENFGSKQRGASDLTIRSSCCIPVVDVPSRSKIRRDKDGHRRHEDRKRSDDCFRKPNDRRQSDDCITLEVRTQAEECRKMQERRQAEECRKIQERKQTEECKKLEERRAEECVCLQKSELKKLEEQKQAEECRKLEEQRQAEQCVCLQERSLSEFMRFEERAQAEECRKLEERRQAEESRKFEDRKKLDESRKLDEDRKLDETEFDERELEERRELEDCSRCKKAEPNKNLEGKKRRKLEERRQAEESRNVDERRQSIDSRKLDERRQTEECRKLKEQKPAEEYRKLDERRQTEEYRKLKEQKPAEEYRKPKEQKPAEEHRKHDERRHTEERRKLEEQKQAEERRKLEEQRQPEECRNLEERKQTEELTLEECRMLEEFRKLRQLDESRIPDDSRNEGLRKLDELRKLDDRRQLNNLKKLNVLRKLDDCCKNQNRKVRDESKKFEDRKKLDESRKLDEDRKLDETEFDERELEERRELEDCSRCKKAEPNKNLEGKKRRKLEELRKLDECFEELQKLELGEDDESRESNICAGGCLLNADNSSLVNEIKYDNSETGRDKLDYSNDYNDYDEPICPCTGCLKESSIDSNLTGEMSLTDMQGPSDKPVDTKISCFKVKKELKTKGKKGDTKSYSGKPYLEITIDRPGTEICVDMSQCGTHSLPYRPSKIPKPATCSIMQPSSGRQSSCSSPVDKHRSLIPQLKKETADDLSLAPCHCSISSESKLNDSF